MGFLHCASRHTHKDTPFAGSVYYIYHIGDFFLLHMNIFCVGLEVITTCESSATHVTEVIGISCMCNNVPFKVPLCMEMFIALKA